MADFFFEAWRGAQKKLSERPDFSIVIPAFNEEARIRETLSEWMKFLDEHYPRKYELLVVMDGCTDHTSDVVAELCGKENSVHPLVHSKMLGKGGALTEAFKQSRGKVLFFTDADGSMPADELLKFMRFIKKCDLVIGSRYFEGSDFTVNLPLIRLIVSRIFNALLRMFFPELNHVCDTQCGAKAVHKKVIDTIGDDLFITDFAFDVNLIYSGLHSGFNMREIGVKYNHVENRSKVSRKLFRTSFVMFLSIVRLRLYYSRLRRMLYADRLKGLIEFLTKAVS